MRIAFWVSGLKDPSPRFRFLQFIEPLREKGHKIDVFVLYPNRNIILKSKNFALQLLEQKIHLICRVAQLLFFAVFKAYKYDIIYTNKDLLPNLKVRWVEKVIWLFNKNLVFDIDDAIYIGPRGEKLKAILPYYKAVIAGSDVLQAYTQTTYGIKSYYIPMAINTNIYQPAKVRATGKLRIGWSGSHHTNVYALPLLREPLTALSKVLDFEFIVISNKNPDLDWATINTRFIQWTEDTEIQGLQQFDIGLMPLKDEPFEQGKCALKAVQYMAIGIPALVSPVGVNSKIVRDGIDGFHCKSIDEFTANLLLLASDEAKRLTLGKNAKSRVDELYSVKVLANQYEAVFKEIAYGK